ncbi:MAG: hypothetical protein ACR2LQ_14015 [Acidimicrobiales bacterium]
MVAPWSAPDVAALERVAPQAPVPSGAAPERNTPRGAPLLGHPLTRFDIVDTALDTIKAAPRVVLGATALFLVPFEIASVLLRRDQLNVDDVNDVITVEWLAAIALRLVALSFVTFAVARLVWAWQHGEAPTAFQAASASLGRAPALLVAWVAVHICEAAAALSFGVPLLFVAPLLFATVPIIAIEECGVFAAMARSWRLASKEVGLAVGGLLVVVVVAGVLEVTLSGLGYVSDSIFDTLDIGGAWIVDVAISLATSLILLPFVAAASTLLYLDLRVRREGLDIELAAARHFR